jgi:hypothetical protein
MPDRLAEVVATIAAIVRDTPGARRVAVRGPDADGLAR